MSQVMFINRHQVYTNWFNPATTIKYRLPTSSHVLLKVFDMLGRGISILIKEIEECKEDDPPKITPTEVRMEDRFYLNK